MDDKAVCNFASLRHALSLGLVVVVLLGLFGGLAGAAQTGVVSDITWGTSRSAVDQTISLLRDSGARWVRANVPWNALEPNGRGSFDSTYLASVDYAVEQARAAGLEVEMPIADGVPYWASGDPNKYQDSSGYHYNRFYRPTSFQDYAEFVAWVVNRYKGLGVHVFEVWNEPNNPGFWPSGPNAASYVEMLKATYPAIKQADPSSTVLMGGLSKSDYNYLQAIYEAGGAPYFDAVNVHPYTGSVDPTSCWQQSGTSKNAIDAFCGVEEVYNTMVRNGDGAKKVWLTEFGYSTYSGTYGVSEAEQAEYLTKAYAKAATWPYVQALFWYQFRNWSSSNEWLSNLGLVSSSFIEKPAYAAFKAYSTGASTTTSTSTSTQTASTSPPSVQLSSPVSGSTFSNTLMFAATASSTIGITKVEFWLDGRRLYTSTTSPYTYTYTVPKKTTYGTHTTKAIAYNTAGQTATATATITRTKTTNITLTVTNTTTTATTANTTNTTNIGLRRSSNYGKRRLVSGTVAVYRTGILLLRLGHLINRKWVRVHTWRLRIHRDGRFRRVLSLRPGRWRVHVYLKHNHVRLRSPYRYVRVAGHRHGSLQPIDGCQERHRSWSVLHNLWRHNEHSCPPRGQTGATLFKHTDPLHAALPSVTAGSVVDPAIVITQTAGARATIDLATAPARQITRG
jgi:polysaccharide biosynthesis protein PslG